MSKNEIYRAQTQPLFLSSLLLDVFLKSGALKWGENRLSFAQMVNKLQENTEKN